MTQSKPKCVFIKPNGTICGKPMKNAYDNKLKKVSKYLWQTTCGHNSRLRLSRG